MNYKQLYKQIIDRAKGRDIPDGYTESHHIIPRSIGGSNDRENLVRLTAREHFLCHYLLTKMYDQNTNEWQKMLHAFKMMKSGNHNHERYHNARLCEACRKHFGSIMHHVQKNENNSQFGTMWITNDIENMKIKNGQNIPFGWRKGRVLYQERQKICITNGTITRRHLQSEPIPNGWVRGSVSNGSYGSIWITNGVDSKRHPKNQSIPDGWRKGRK